jgi:hypothetical protein
VSSLRSQYGQTGKGTIQTFPLGPGEKKVVSRCIILEPHLGHWMGDGFAARSLKMSSTLVRESGMLLKGYPMVQNGTVQCCSLVR